MKLKLKRSLLAAGITLICFLILYLYHSLLTEGALPLFLMIATSSGAGVASFFLSGIEAIRSRLE